ncbi:hypothetical protein DFH07DRAFT_110325 [Mycena maculata]|uniref:Uncharacterized protein n=1 Tax=Mycena maculata TaxID=230809 RepID=A0AAD7MXV9_9AGAR|nr:hypothetical protein DFH07DRAFT_110325 [Mycena maculata]
MAHAMLIIWHVQHFRGQGASAIVARYLFAGAYHTNESARIIRPILPKGSAAAPEVLITIPMLENFSKTTLELNYLCKDAFRAYEDRQEQMRTEQEKMEIKRMDRPLRYRCANLVCGIGADTGRVLQRCNGACDDDKKPSYCGKACHKPFCKAGAPCSVIDTEFTTIPAGRAAPSGSIQLPMGGITFSSSTMSPEFMKEIKEHMDDSGVFR